MASSSSATNLPPHRYQKPSGTSSSGLAMGSQAGTASPASSSIPIPGRGGASSLSSHGHARMVSVGPPLGTSSLMMGSSIDSHPTHHAGGGRSNPNPALVGSHPDLAKAGRAGASPMDTRGVGERSVAGGQAFYKRNLSVAQFPTTTTTPPQAPGLNPLVGDPEPPFHRSLDDYANSQRVQNAWWRAWALHRGNYRSFAFTPNHSIDSVPTLSVSTDALNMEGVDKPHKKLWEEYFDIFLDRLATNSDALPFLASLQSSSRPRKQSSTGSIKEPSPIPTLDKSLSFSMSGMSDNMGLGDAMGPSVPGSSPHDLDESVHGGNFFATMFRSSSNASLVPPSPNSDDHYANMKMPWEMPSPSDGNGVGGEGLPLGLQCSSLPIGIPTQLGRLPGSDLDGSAVGMSVDGRSSEKETGPPVAVDTILKKAFTGFHNSQKFGQDNVSAYLGDDLSVHRNSYFSAYNSSAAGLRMKTAHSSPSSSGNMRLLVPNVPKPPQARTHGRPDAFVNKLLPVREPELVAAATTDVAVFLRMQDCSNWKRTEQHWLLPGVVAMCTPDFTEQPSPLSCALSALADSEAAIPVDTTFSCTDHSGMMPPSPRQLEEEGAAIQASFNPLQTYILGEVLVCSSHLATHANADFRQLPTVWETRLLVLKQNFLFEYLPHEPRWPIGYAHLQHATISPRLDNASVVHLCCTRESVPTSPFHTILLRAMSVNQATRWMALFKAAANLKIEDMYEFLTVKVPLGEPASAQVATSQSSKASELGRGRFATVRKARRKIGRSGRHGVDQPEHTGGMGDAVCALKIVNKAAFWSRVADGKERHDTLTREILAQAVLTAQGDWGDNCPIVRLFGVFETAESIVLELELMSRKDLFDELSTSGVLKEQKTAAIVYEVVRAVAFCRQYNIAHRDIKLSNIIFPLDAHENPANATRVKLADFGMAGFFGNKDGTLRGRCGTPGYVAPEILCAGVNEGYGDNVDVFSVGVVAYTLLCGYEPFYGVTDKQLIAANKLAEYEFHDPEWTRISSDAKDLVSKMLVRDPVKRIKPAQALHHPWLARFSQSTKDKDKESEGACAGLLRSLSASLRSSSKEDLSRLTSRSLSRENLRSSSRSSSRSPSSSVSSASSELSFAQPATRLQRWGGEARSQYASPLCSVM